MLINIDWGNASYRAVHRSTQLAAVCQALQSHHLHADWQVGCLTFSSLGCGGLPPGSCQLPVVGLFQVKLPADLRNAQLHCNHASGLNQEQVLISHRLAGMSQVALSPSANSEQMTYQSGANNRLTCWSATCGLMDLTPRLAKMS